MNAKLHTLASKISDMLDARAAGTLKRSADDFISGLVQAYGILTDEANQSIALENALQLAKQPYK